MEEATDESVTFALHVVERKYVTVLRAKNLAGGLVRGDTKITSRKRWGRLWFPFPSPPFASEASKCDQPPPRVITFQKFDR